MREECGRKDLKARLEKSVIAGMEEEALEKWPRLVDGKSINRKEENSIILI